jgi:hypothetical protein
LAVGMLISFCRYDYLCKIELQKLLAKSPCKKKAHTLSDVRFPDFWSLDIFPGRNPSKRPVGYLKSYIPKSMP